MRITPSSAQGVALLYVRIILLPIHSALPNVTKSSYIFSFTTSPPIVVNGVEISRQSQYDKDVYLPYDRTHQRMSLNFQFADTRCPINQWYCNGVCIHRRKRCSLRGGCHPQYPMSCDRKDACYRSEDDCWHRACSGEECQWGDTSAQLGMKQRRYLASCPDEKNRLAPCNTDSNPHLPRGIRQQFLCFYNDETYCPADKTCAHVSSKCFKNRHYDPYGNSLPLYPPNKNEHINNLLHNQLGKTYNNFPPPLHGGSDHPYSPVGHGEDSLHRGNLGEQLNYPIYPNPNIIQPPQPIPNTNWRNPNCPNKWTPCYGMCMDSDYPFKCGDGLCLSVNDMQFYRECDGACIRNHVSCNGGCRLGYSPCLSKNQCFKDPEGRCDNRRDCWDATDETGCFRTFLKWVALPTVIFLFLVVIAVYFTLGWFIRRTLSSK